MLFCTGPTGCNLVKPEGPEVDFDMPRGPSSWNPAIHYKLTVNKPHITYSLIWKNPNPILSTPCSTVNVGPYSLGGTWVYNSTSSSLDTEYLSINDTDSSSANNKINENQLLWFFM